MDDHTWPVPVPNTLLVAACFAAVLVYCGVAYAGEGEPAAQEMSPPTATVATEPPAAAPVPATSELGRSIDETHELFEQGILQRVIRLDNFFGSDTARDQHKSGYELRWRSSLRVDQDGAVNPATTLWAHITLSRINERLHLLIAGESDPQSDPIGLPQDPGNPGYDRNVHSTRVANTELQYSLLQTPSLHLFLGAGVRFVLPPEAFVRSRAQYRYRLNDVTLLRCSETIFVKNFDVLGETSEVALEHLLNRKTLLRLAASGTVSNEIKGMEWGSELSLNRELSPRRNITFIGGVYGNSSVNDAVGSYRLLARYRQNVWRPWLYYEVEPELLWSRREDGSFPTGYAITLRLEVILRGKEP